MTTEEFIKANADADISRLALQHAGRKDIDLPYALDQIAGRRKARLKLPQWAATEGIVYPPHLSMEQCSSEQTARYKADVAARLMKQATNEKPAIATDGTGGSVLVDLTGGFGVDFSYLAPLFGRAVYIERQSRLCDISRHNMACLGITQAEVVCGDCTQIIEATGHATMIYADPARRDGHGGRTFAISDCTPDVLALRDTLLAKADFTMIKLSPMLDWRKAVADMGGCVGEVHIGRQRVQGTAARRVVTLRRTGTRLLRQRRPGSLFHTRRSLNTARNRQFCDRRRHARRRHAALPLRAQRIADEGGMLRPHSPTVRLKAGKPRQPPVHFGRSHNQFPRPLVHRKGRYDHEQARTE
ncbi:MAG: protein-L-isoaspartate O-methyltransferase, partial [Clostridiales bacterium]|nr:protein-L-isoaspartate O-methyltransferase [Clostridiales bacterium]